MQNKQGLIFAQIFLLTLYSISLAVSNVMNSAYNIMSCMAHVLETYRCNTTLLSLWSSTLCLKKRFHL